MRRLIAFDRVSADGYFADASGALDWTVPDDALDRQAAAGMAAGPGTLLFGRRTYEAFESFWPHVAASPDDPDAPDPHAAARRSPELRAMATWLDAATKVVVSRTRAEVPWRNSRLLRELDAASVEALKREPGPDVMIFGSGSVVSQLTALGLVDEYHLVVSPVLLGGGQSLVASVPARTRLALREATSYPSGNVVLRYARA